MTFGSAVRGAVAVLVLGTISANPVQDATQDRVKDLEAKLSAAEKVNFELTKKNLQLEKQVKQLQLQLATVQVSRPQEQKTVPDSWKPFQFNGVTYYVLPLDGGRVDQKPVIAK
jgi:hypothetical protein